MKSCASNLSPTSATKTSPAVILRESVFTFVDQTRSIATQRACGEGWRAFGVSSGSSAMEAIWIVAVRAVESPTLASRSAAFSSRSGRGRL
jgi:hypothetical protein